MEQLSFFEKLSVLFQNILAHPIFICILLSPVLIFFLNKKIKKKAIIIIYIAILAIVLFVGNTTIFSLFDNLMDNIFMVLYFPNFVTLFLVELVSAIICLITFIKKGITKTNKIINITAFSIIQTIFILILTIVQTNKIDIYKENALYANNDILTLMQLLVGTFFIQIISLLVIKAIDKVTDKLDGKTTIKPHENRITHVKLSGAKIIKKKEVEIKQTPIEPLNKSLIEKTKISPLDLNEEIIKEQKEAKKPKFSDELMKKAKELKKDRMIFNIEPPQPLTPLNKSLIKEEKIIPIDINKEIKEQKLSKIIKEKELKPSLISRIKNKFSSSKTKDIPNNITKAEETLDISVKNVMDFKPEFPDQVKTNIEPIKEIKNQPEEKELITNLKIIDYQKMKKAIKDIEIVYTL